MKIDPTTGALIPENEAEKAQIAAMVAGGFQQQPARQPTPTPVALPLPPIAPVVAPVMESAGARAVREAAEQRALREQAEQRLAAANQQTALTAEQFQAQMRQFQEQTTAQMNQYTAAVQAAEQRRYAAELAAYREKVIASYGGKIIAEMVGGNTPDEIIRSTTGAVERWNHYQREAQSAIQRPITLPQIPMAPPPPGQQFAPPGFQTPPQQGQYQGPPQQQGGWPQPTNPMTPAGTAPQNAPNLSLIASEQSVRDGSWARNRKAVMDGLARGQQVPLPSASLPPQQPQFGPGPTPVNYAQQPGGVYQPQGHPSGPALQHAGQQLPAPIQPTWMGGQPQQQWQQPMQVPQYQPPAPQFQQQGQQFAPPGFPQPPQQGYVDPAQAQLQAAQDAVNRTHAGQNPVAGGPGNQGVADGAAQLAAWQRANPGMTPQSAMQQRFANSPPVAPQQ